MTILQKFYGLKPVIKASIIFLLIVAVCVGLAVAVSVVTTESNHVTGTPLTPVSTATPTPTSTATPTPTATPVTIIRATLTANDTDGETYNFHLGDTLHLTAQCNVTQAGIEVQLWNLGAYKETQLTDANGRVSWDRKPTVAYDYCVKIDNTIP